MTKSFPGQIEIGSHVMAGDPASQIDTPPGALAGELLPDGRFAITIPRILRAIAEIVESNPRATHITLAGLALGSSEEVSEQRWPKDKDLEPPFVFAQGDIVFDTSAHTLIVRGKQVPLKRLEFSLLEYFARNPRRVLSRAELLREVWDTEYLGTERTVDVHVGRVRRKLGGEQGDSIITTVVGYGYKLDNKPGRGA